MRLIFFIFFSLSIEAKSILIDPGHGGNDEGAHQVYQILGKKGSVLKETI